MEKLREAFEIRAKNMGYDLSMKNGQYTNINTLELFLGYMMCNEDRLDTPKHETVEQWISVKDRLPEEDGLVLVYPNKYEYIAFWHKWNCPSNRFEANDFTVDDELGYEIIVDVTHWRPLPPPPDSIGER